MELICCSVWGFTILSLKGQMLKLCTPCKMGIHSILIHKKTWKRALPPIRPCVLVNLEDGFATWNMRLIPRTYIVLSIRWAPRSFQRKIATCGTFEAAFLSRVKRIIKMQNAQISLLVYNKMHQYNRQNDETNPFCPIFYYTIVVLLHCFNSSSTEKGIYSYIHVSCLLRTLGPVLQQQNIFCQPLYFSL